MRAILSTGAVARDNHAIDPHGWIVPRSKSVPLVNGHLDTTEGIRSVLGLVSDIGPTENAVLESGQVVPALVGMVVFADVASSDAAVAQALYAGGFASALSVSFIPRTWQPARDRGPGAMNISSAELLEVSCVVVPSDPDARVIARAFRNRGTSLETTTDRRARAQALVARGRFLESRTLDQRVARAAEIAAGSRADEAAAVDQLRQRLLARKT
jgi:hypothetical protein